MNTTHPIRAWRKSQNPKVTLDYLAEKLKRTRSTISRWETGERAPDTGDILKLSAITGIPVEDIMRASIRSE